MNTGVYEIVLNNKRYIGSTGKSFVSRYNQHLRDLKQGIHHSTYLQNAYNKYGEVNMRFNILEELEGKERLIKREQHYIDILSPEYNICMNAYSCLGVKHTQETIDKHRNNLFPSGEGYNFKYKSTQIKSYLDIPLPKVFTDSEIGKLTRLSRCIYSDSNLLAKRSTNNRIVPLSKDDIINIVGLSMNRFYEFFGKALKHKILKDIVLDNNTYYCFNPIYYNSTNYMPLYLFLAFQTELSEHLPDWVINKYLDEWDSVQTDNN